MIITEKRYDIIKKCGNTLFKFHNKKATDENKKVLTNILNRILKTNEFTWTVDKETKAINVSFALGMIVVRVENDTFYVSMDAETKKRLQDFKTNGPMQNDEEPNEQPEPVNEPSITTFEVKSNQEEIEEITSAKENYEEYLHSDVIHHQEKELNADNQPNSIVQDEAVDTSEVTEIKRIEVSSSSDEKIEEKINEEGEEIKGESVFGDFFGSNKEEWI